MSDELANVNSLTYYGTASASSGSTAISPTHFNLCDKVVFSNLSSDSIIVKTGNSTVTANFPTSGNEEEGTIVPPATTFSMRKALGHTSFAVESSTASALYAIQGTNGK